MVRNTVARTELSAGSPGSPRRELHVWCGGRGRRAGSRWRTGPGARRTEGMRGRTPLLRALSGRRRRGVVSPQVHAGVLKDVARGKPPVTFLEPLPLMSGSRGPVGRDGTAEEPSPSLRERGPFQACLGPQGPGPGTEGTGGSAGRAACGVLAAGLCDRLGALCDLRGRTVSCRLLPHPGRWPPPESPSVISSPGFCPSHSPCSYHSPQLLSVPGSRPGSVPAHTPWLLCLVPVTPTGRGSAAPGLGPILMAPRP